ncbi:sn-glycerol-3-phosphate transport system permease protein UgpA [compost metagenome]
MNILVFEVIDILTQTQSNRKLHRSSSIVFFLFTLIPILLYLCFFIYPAALGFMFSLTNYDGLSRSYDFIGLSNYINILKDSRVGNSVQFTSFYTIVVTFLKLFIALVLAILLSSKLRGRGFMRSVYFFPAVLSLITTGLIFSEIFKVVLPQIGERLNILWMTDNILADPQNAIIGIIIADLWHGVAVPMVIFMAGLGNVPNDLREASVLDGANPLQQFFYITLPFLIPMLNVNLVLSIKASITVFDLIMAMTSGGPGQATESIGYLIYNQGFNDLKFGYAAAESIYVFLAIGIISFLQIKLLNRKEVGQQ